MTFPEGAFRRYLDGRNMAHAPTIVQCARHCIDSGATRADQIDAVFSGVTSHTRSRYRNAMRRFEEFQEATA